MPPTWILAPFLTLALAPEPTVLLGSHTPALVPTVLLGPLAPPHVPVLAPALALLPEVLMPIPVPCLAPALIPVIPSEPLQLAPAPTLVLAAGSSVYPFSPSYGSRLQASQEFWPRWAWTSLLVPDPGSALGLWHVDCPLDLVTQHQIP